MKRNENDNMIFDGGLLVYSRRVLFSFVLCCLTICGLSAQNNQVPPSKIILRDSIQLGDSARQGLLNKIIQPFRFRENELNKEKERVVELLRRLSTDGDIAIDSITVNEIASDLMQLADSLASNTTTTQRLQQEVQQTLINLDSKAPKQLVDSIRLQLGNVLQGIADETKEANLQVKKELQAKLNQLREIQYSCGYGGLSTATDTLGDTLIVNYQRCLQARTKIYGWHLPSMNEKVKNYNLNYLTDLILYGYELGSNGSATNPKTLEGLLEGGILEKNQPYGKAISLSIFSNSSSVVETFLNKNSAQAQFITDIKLLITKYNLNGINIYFERIQPKDNLNFSAFIKRLKSELSAVDESLSLTVSIPPIANSKDLAMASAFDFESLNPWVDNYLVQTQKLNITATRIPFSLSPLYADPSKTRSSIEETFAFYSNGKIPVGKLIMTVSYQGISWSMPDFEPGTRAVGFGSFLEFKTIQESIVPTIGQPGGAVMGYDPEQASAYLNYGTMYDLNQIWFEDSRSLADKYNWALNNSIGGVAIWGLGYDEGYTELWDVLGAALIEVDSIVVDTHSLDRNVADASLSFLDYFKIYRNDIHWAAINDIYIGDPDEEIFCYFDPYPKRDLIYKLAQTEGVSDFWDYTSKVNSLNNNGYFSIDSCKACVSLLGRWDRYAEITGITSISFFVIFLISISIILLGVRKYGDDWSLRGVFLGISISTGLLAFVALFFYCFFNTQIGLIGAGSREVGVWLLISIFASGIVAGLIINRLRMAKKFSYRDLP